MTQQFANHLGVFCPLFICKWEMKTWFRLPNGTSNFSHASLFTEIRNG